MTCKESKQLNLYKVAFRELTRLYNKQLFYNNPVFKSKVSFHNIVRYSSPVRFLRGFLCCHIILFVLNTKDPLYNVKAIEMACSLDYSLQKINQGAHPTEEILTSFYAR